MPNGRWAGSTRRKRLPPGWSSRIQPAVIHRDPYCMLRTHCDGAPSTQADHIQPGDDHRMENYQGACKRCHQWKSSHEGGKAAAAARASRRRAPERHPGLLW